MMKKPYFSTVLFSLVLTFCLSAPASWAESAPEPDARGNNVTVKVMTYNIHHGADSDDVLNLERIASVIRDSGADIVGLQEVDRHLLERSNFEDQAKRLSEMLEMNYVYGANLDFGPAAPGEPHRQYGTAILSKYPILFSENHLLSSFGEEQRGLLEATINVKGTHLHFFNTHLGLSQDQRLAQLSEIKAIAAKRTGAKIVVGDMNAEPDSAEIKIILEGFRDTFADKNDAYTYSATSPESRIDYILSTTDVILGEHEVLTSLASDHLPVTAFFTLQRNAPFENGSHK